MSTTGHSSPCLCSACDHEHSHHRKPLLSLCDVDFVRDNRVILNDVNLTVDRGDFIAVTGPNGGGKTTLLRLILGLLKPSAGKIVYYDSEGKVGRAPLFGYLPQKNSVDAHFPITVGEVVASGLLSIKGLDKAEVKRRVEDALATVGLTDLADRSIGRLSGGQLQRALFGRAIVGQAPVLVLDEPLSYIDKHFEERLYEIIRELAKRTTIILVSHEMSEIGAMADRHVVVDRALHECTAQHHKSYTSFDCNC